MRKVFLILSSLILITSFVPTKSWADNANPPKITSVEQITTGPYTVGDIVTFEIKYSGGFPGINRVQMSIDCLTNNVGPQGTLIWNKDSKDNSNQNTGSIFISGYVLPCHRDTQPIREVQPKSVSISDQTGLVDLLPPEGNRGLPSLELSKPSLKLTFNETNLLPTPIGEIKPTKLPDEVSLKFPSKVKVGSVITLPRLSKSGVPISFRASSRKICDITWDTFVGDLGGNLQILAPGECAFRQIGTLNDRYESVKIKTSKLVKIKPQNKSGGINLISFKVTK